jgi:surface antigen
MADNRRRRRRVPLWAFAAPWALGMMMPAALADPPPWTAGTRTPAESQIAYSFPPGLKDGRCRPDKLDSAAVRGLVGPGRGFRTNARFRSSAGKASTLDNTAIGALMAAVGGKRPPRGISRKNEICFSQSFEHIPDRGLVAWSDRRRTVQYSVTPLRTLKTSDGLFCREYAAKATVNGHAADVYGTACRQGDGTWFLVD